MSTRRDGYAAAIETLLSVARRESLMLAIAQSAFDDDAAAIAAARLRWAIDAVRPLVAIGDAAPHVDELDRIANRAQRWLVDQPPRSLAELARLVDRAARRDRRAVAIAADHAVLVDLELDRLDLTRISLAGARLVEVSLRGAVCTAGDARGSRWQRCAIERATLAMAVLSDARLARCDLSLAELTGTGWQRAAVVRCCLRGAALVDARLERASFTDCDLRGADLAIAGSPHAAGLAGAQFVRCDLRDTDWRGRDLAGASFIDCTLLGARGAPRLARAR